MRSGRYQIRYRLSVRGDLSPASCRLGTAQLILPEHFSDEIRERAPVGVPDLTGRVAQAAVADGAAPLRQRIVAPLGRPALRLVADGLRLMAAPQQAGAVRIEDGGRVGAARAARRSRCRGHLISTPSVRPPWVQPGNGSDRPDGSDGSRSRMAEGGRPPAAMKHVAGLPAVVLCHEHGRVGQLAAARGRPHPRPHPAARPHPTEAVGARRRTPDLVADHATPRRAHHHLSSDLINGPARPETERHRPLTMKASREIQASN